jgi:hypothetical protein
MLSGLAIADPDLLTAPISAHTHPAREIRLGPLKAQNRVDRSAFQIPPVLKDSVRYKLNKLRSKIGLFSLYNSTT